MPNFEVRITTPVELAGAKQLEQELTMKGRFSKELHIGHGDAAERKVRTFYPHNASHDFSAHGLAIMEMIARVVK